MSTLAESYDALLLDLDGTLYRGSDAVPGAVTALRATTVRLLYVTNNASRAPHEVGAHLRELGFAAHDDDVVTSSQAGARMLGELVGGGSSVLVVGTPALADEVRAAGFAVVDDASDRPDAVIQGHSPDTGWRRLAEATVAIRAGAVWVATNTDPTLPSERGLLPGNGSMVDVVRTATGQEPHVAGKPALPILRDAMARCGSENVLVVGDRLDTDIAGARAAGLDSLLVLTGVSTAADLLHADPGQRPDLLAADLGALTRRADELAPSGRIVGWSDPGRRRHRRPQRWRGG